MNGGNSGLRALRVLRDTDGEEEEQGSSARRGSDNAAARGAKVRRRASQATSARPGAGGQARGRTKETGAGGVKRGDLRIKVGRFDVPLPQQANVSSGLQKMLVPYLTFSRTSE